MYKLSGCENTAAGHVTRVLWFGLSLWIFEAHGQPQNNSPSSEVSKETRFRSLRKIASSCGCCCLNRSIYFSLVNTLPFPNREQSFVWTKNSVTQRKAETFCLQSKIVRSLPQFREATKSISCFDVWHKKEGTNSSAGMSRQWNRLHVRQSVPRSLDIGFNTCRSSPWHLDNDSLS